MDQHEYLNVTRKLLKRSATDLERKLAAACATGALAAGIVDVLTSYHVAITPMLANLIPLAVGVLGGYLTHSVGSTTVQTETHRDGTTVTTSTSSVGIITPEVAAAAKAVADAASNVAPVSAAPSFTTVLTGPDGVSPAPAVSQPTLVQPSGADRFLAARAALHDGPSNTVEDNH